MEKIISTQLDLASQKENLERIFEFIDLAAKYGYNGICLYLEDRIKTKSYPYISDEESYTPDEIRKIVAYAQNKGIELFPASCNFSHVGRFLAHEELRHFAELRGNIKGRFNEAGSAPYVTACPLLPEAQAYFNNYMAEVAELFPSKYYFAGMDEDFDIGSCELCKADVEKHGGMGHLLLNHIKSTNEFLKSIGKVMVCDDDMFCYCPEIIPELPKDIVLMSWNYEYIDRFPRAQFGNQRQKDLCKLYDKYGLKYIPTTWSNFVNNVDTFTKYADEYSPMGYHNTTWQMSAEQMHFTYPLVAYTGLLWNGELVDEPLERMKRVIRELCETDDLQEVAILAEAATKVFLIRTPMYHIGKSIIRRTAAFDDRYRDTAYIAEALEGVKANNAIAYQIKLRAKRAKLLYDVLIAAQDVLDWRCGIHNLDKEKMLAKLAALRTDMKEQYAIQNKLWDEFREGIPRTRLINEEKYDIGLIDGIIETLNTCEYGKDGVLDMMMLMQDKSTASKIKTTVKYADGTTEELFGVYKPLATACYYIMDDAPYLYTVSSVIRGDKEVVGCDVEVSGYGATTIAYISAYQNGNHYVPVNVEAVEGRVENPSHLLDYDTKVCMIGNPDMILAMQDSRLSDEKSKVSIKFEKED